MAATVVVISELAKQSNNRKAFALLLLTLAIILLIDIQWANSPFIRTDALMLKLFKFS